MKLKLKRAISNLFGAIAAVLMVAVVFFSLVFISFKVIYTETTVRGYSMLPTLNSTVATAEEDGDTAYLNPYAEIKSGDVVVAEVAWWDKGPIIKRAVGVPGDEIQIIVENEFYKLLVNGKELYAKEINSNTTQHYNQYTAFLTNPQNIANGNVKLNENLQPCIKLNQNEYFLIGDNWGHSSDSLTHGVVFELELIGRVDIVVKQNENKIISIFTSMLKIMFS